MKISRILKWFSEVYQSFVFVEILIIIAILGLLAAIIIPNYVKLKEQSQYRQESEKLTSIHVGDTVTIKGINQQGTVNYVPENGYADILVIGKTGEPTILKGVNIKLISK
jgi:hypothetical protein